MEDSCKNKRSITEVGEEGKKETENAEEIPSTSANTDSTTATEQKQTTSETSEKPIFHQPPKKKRKRSFSPVKSNTKLTPSCSGSSSRRENTPPRDYALDVVVHNLIRQYNSDGVGGSPTNASGPTPAGPGPMSSPQPPPPSLSPRGGTSQSPQVRRLGSLEGTGVGILRDGAGWPGFGSEEEMGMSSSGAEAEDERNNKYAGFEWQWDDNAKSNACCLAKMKTEVRFHLDYSCGTAAARGSENMRDGQFFWEVKMVSPVYGTDMMIGVGTKQVDLNQYSRAFCSMLGHEASSESCGLSYTGRFQKGGIGRMYCSKFGQGAIIGMHLDMWFGTLTYYKDGKYLGVATKNLLGKTWYPIVSSTAARSSMRLVNTKSFPSNLQFWCCQALRKAVPPEHNVLDVVPLAPGLKNFLEDNLAWLLRAHVTKLDVECKTKGTQTMLSMMSKRWKEKMEHEEDV